MEVRLGRKPISHIRKLNATLAVLAVAWNTIAMSSETHAAEAVKPDRVVAYKKVEPTKSGAAQLNLHVFNPPGHQPSDKRPAIVFFFGGGWNGGSPAQFYPHCQYLASRGMVAMAAEYRVHSTHQTTPRECVKDGVSAVRFIRAHAGELGVDPERLAAGGGSAGGHVATAAGNCDGFDEPAENASVSARPDALVLFNPVFDNGPEGYGHDRVKDYWRHISPMHNLGAHSPPTVVFLGTQDNLIPVASAQAYKNKMESFGRRCDLHLYEGQPHGFFNFKNQPYYVKTVIEMDRFLASLGWLEGEPTLRGPTTDAPGQN